MGIHPSGEGNCAIRVLSKATIIGYVAHTSYTTSSSAWAINVGKASVNKKQNVNKAEIIFIFFIIVSPFGGLRLCL